MEPPELRKIDVLGIDPGLRGVAWVGVSRYGNALDGDVHDLIQDAKYKKMSDIQCFEKMEDWFKTVLQPVILKYQPRLVLVEKQRKGKMLILLGGLMAWLRGVHPNVRWVMPHIYKGAFKLCTKDYGNNKKVAREFFEKHSTGAAAGVLSKYRGMYAKHQGDFADAFVLANYGLAKHNSKK